MGIKFNDEPIPDSPFKAYILPDVGEGRKIELGHVPDAGLQVNKPIAFTIQMNGAKGLIDGKVISPSGSEDDCFVSPIDEGPLLISLIPSVSNCVCLPLCLTPCLPFVCRLVGFAIHPEGEWHPPDPPAAQRHTHTAESLQDRHRT